MKIVHTQLMLKYEQLFVHIQIFTFFEKESNYVIIQIIMSNYVKKKFTLI